MILFIKLWVILVWLLCSFWIHTRYLEIRWCLIRSLYPRLRPCNPLWSLYLLHHFQFLFSWKQVILNFPFSFLLWCFLLLLLFFKSFILVVDVFISRRLPFLFILFRVNFFFLHCWIYVLFIFPYPKSLSNNQLELLLCFLLLYLFGRILFLIFWNFGILSWIREHKLHGIWIVMLQLIV